MASQGKKASQAPAPQGLVPSDAPEQGWDEAAEDLMSGAEVEQRELTATTEHHGQRADKVLAIDSGEVRKGSNLPGEQTLDPSFGCPALWIEPAQRDLAIAEGYLTVDASTVVATQLNQLLGDRPQALFGPDEMKAILDGVKDHSAGLIEALHPQPLNLAALTRIFRALLEDGLPIENGNGSDAAN